MKKRLKLNFCIIPNPFSNGSRNMIFISKSGRGKKSIELSENDEYKDIKDVIEKFGYTETAPLQFESSNNSIEESSQNEIKKLLEEFGLKYSRKLEVDIIKELSNLKAEADKLAHKNIESVNGITDFSYDIDDLPELTIETKNKLIESKKELFKFKFREPEVGEKVTLYFYLFLELAFNHQGKPSIRFNGDFRDSDDYDDRNYIKIVSSDFERVFDPNKPNSIILSSCKKQSDLLKEVGILYSGFFRYQTSVEKSGAVMIQEKKYPYKFAEIRKFLTPNQAIVVETNRMGFDTLINLSNKIKIESIAESRKFISISDIEQKAEELNSFLSRRMVSLSEADDFEGAAKMKKDVDYINTQISHVKSSFGSHITTEEYFKLFSSY
jgi:signal recognition particle subunit SEC65